MSIHLISLVPPDLAPVRRCILQMAYSFVAIAAMQLQTFVDDSIA